MSTGSSSGPGGKLSIHSGSGTLRGGGVSKIYGNMASFKQYKRKIDFRLPLLTIVCIASIASILFVYGLYQLKGHDAIVEYIKNTRDTAHSISRHKRQDAIADSFVPSSQQNTVEDAVKEGLLEKDNNEKDIIHHDIEEKEESGSSTDETNSSEEERVTSAVHSTPIEAASPASNATETPVESTTEEVDDENKLTIEELTEMYNDFTSTYKTIWSLFAVNLIALLFLVPATVLFHFDFLEINRYKTIFRFIIILIMLFLIVQLLYLISPILTCSSTFPKYIDRLFAKETTSKTDRGIRELQDMFSCDFETYQILVDRGIQDPCIPKIKDSLFPCYATVLLIVLDILPFIFAFFTYAWDAWIKDCTTVREARMRVELNNQRRPRTREEIIDEQIINGDYDGKGITSNMGYSNLYEGRGVQVR